MKISLACQPGTTSQVKTGNWREESFPVINHDICISCGQCDMFCPEGVCFKTDQKNASGKFFYEADLDYCKGCGICAEICPVKAIIMKEENK